MPLKNSRVSFGIGLPPLIMQRTLSPKSFSLTSLNAIFLNSLPKSEFPSFAEIDIPFPNFFTVFSPRVLISATALFLTVFQNNGTAKT